MRQAVQEFRLATRPKKFLDITADVCGWVRDSGIQTGLLTLFVRHTTASLVIQENADPDVMKDLGDAFAMLAPEDADWRHDTEGPDDMPGHVKAALAPGSLSIPVMSGRPVLGVWQAIYLAEWRDSPHTRTVVAHLLGE